MKEDTLIRKVLRMAEVKTFECHGELHIRSTSSPIDIVNPVPVYGSGADKEIGFAMVDPRNNDTAIFLVRECPERLDIENGIPYCVEILAYSVEVREGVDVIVILSVQLTPVGEYPAGCSTPPSAISMGVKL